MKFWIILTLLAISTRASIATFILTNLLLRGINAGFEETIGVGIGPAKFGLKKNFNLNLGRFPQKRARGTPDYPYYNQTNYTRNYPRVPAPRLGRANYTQGPLPYDQVNFPANNSYVLVPGYGQQNYSANYPQVPGPKRGQRKYQANYPNVPGPRYGKRNYSANFPNVPVRRPGQGSQPPVPYLQGDFSANDSHVPVPYGQGNFSANDLYVPVPSGQGNYSENYIPEHAPVMDNITSWQDVKSTEVS